MRIRAVSPLLLIVLVRGLAACGDDDSDTTTTSGQDDAPAETTEQETTDQEPQTNAPAPSGDAVRSAEVEMDDFDFVPAAVTIEAGGKVIWKNRDSAEHTATLDDGSFDTGPLAEDKLKAQTFKQPGAYPYHCSIHPEMTGTVEVVAE
jgi:plastocyanin